MKASIVVQAQNWRLQESKVFNAANHAFGSVFLRFDSAKEFNAFHANSSKHIRVKVN